MLQIDTNSIWSDSDENSHSNVDSGFDVGQLHERLLPSQMLFSQSALPSDFVLRTFMLFSAMQCAGVMPKRILPTYR
jgi:hypothetical protein